APATRPAVHATRLASPRSAAPPPLAAPPPRGPPASTCAADVRAHRQSSTATGRAGAAASPAPPPASSAPRAAFPHVQTAAWRPPPEPLDPVPPAAHHPAHRETPARDSV